MSMVYEERHSVDMNGLDLPTTLTELQKNILSKRLDMGYLEHSGYELQDMVNSKFDPLKHIDDLTDVKEAGSYIASAIRSNKHIVLVSDFDADGISSAGVLENCFRYIFKYDNYSAIVNERKTGTGYSKTLNKRILELHKNKHIDMIISADHGSNNEDSFKHLKEQGVGSLVITDHHHVEYNNYPHSADFFINPQRKECNYYKDVSGCFVAFITMVSTYMSLHGRYDKDVFNILLPYVALSTISDVMNLKLAINRQVVKVGLNEMNSLRNPVWKAIKNALGVNNKFNYNDLAFKIAPLINTANRVNEEQLAYKLMVSNVYVNAYKYADVLLKLSVVKKEAQKLGTLEALQQIDNLPQKNSAVVSISSKYAVNGIVASSVGEKISRPVICFIHDDNEKIIMGSGRGIVDGVDLVSLFDNINNRDENILSSYGGHKLAAGCAIYKDKLEIFRTMFEEEVITQIGGVSDTNVIIYDVKLKPEDITPYIVKDAMRLAPYGKDWVKPIYFSTLKIDKILVFGTMAKVIFKVANTTISGMCFFNNKKTDITYLNIKDKIKQNDTVYVTYTLDIATFRNIADLNIVIDTIELKRS